MLNKNIINETIKKNSGAMKAMNMGKKDIQIKLVNGVTERVILYPVKY